MPEYHLYKRWTLKDNKYCDGCPFHGVESNSVGDGIWHSCDLGCYRDKEMSGWSKKRPRACVEEFGER